MFAEAAPFAVGMKETANFCDEVVPIDALEGVTVNNALLDRTESMTKLAEVLAFVTVIVSTFVESLKTLPKARLVGTAANPACTPEPVTATVSVEVVPVGVTVTFAEFATTIVGV